MDVPSPYPHPRVGIQNGSSSSSVKRSFDQTIEDVEICDAERQLLERVMQYVEAECPQSNDRDAILRVVRADSENVLSHNVFEVRENEKYYSELRTIELGCYLARLASLSGYEVSSCISRCILMAFDSAPANDKESAELPPTGSEGL